MTISISVCTNSIPCKAKWRERESLGFFWWLKAARVINPLFHICGFPRGREKVERYTPRDPDNLLKLLLFQPFIRLSAWRSFPKGQLINNGCHSPLLLLLLLLFQRTGTPFRAIQWQCKWIRHTNTGLGTRSYRIKTSILVINELNSWAIWHLFSHDQRVGICPNSKATK